MDRTCKWMEKGELAILFLAVSVVSSTAVLLGSPGSRNGLYYAMQTVMWSFTPRFCGGVAIFQSI